MPVDVARFARPLAAKSPRLVVAFTRAALASLGLGIGCGAKTTLPCDDDGSGPPSYDCAGCERPSVAREPPACEGEGLVFRAPDACVDDGGETDVDDELEVHCFEGVARFCLSHEECPWRDGRGEPGDPRTCSTAGLRATFFAAVRSGCDAFQGRRRLCCSPDGRIGYGEGEHAAAVP